MQAESANSERKSTDPSWNYRLAGIISGILIVAGHFYSQLALLQLLAFFPIMYGTLKYNAPKSQTIVAGLYMAMFCVLPQIAYLRMPVIITLILMTYMMAIIIVHSIAISLLIKKPAISSALLIGITMYIIDYLSCTVIPVWGLAQSLVRPWTAYPMLIGFISVTGICGVMFVIATIQSLAAHCLTSAKNKMAIISTIAIILGLCGLANFLTQPNGKLDTLRIATVGWVLDETKDESNPSTEIGFEKLFIELAQLAVEQGAQIITTGELGFYFNKFTKEEVLGRFFSFAIDNNVWLAIGVFDLSLNQNMVLFISPEGKIVEDYTKTYLTPLEPGKKGPGHLKTINIEGHDIGTMICQDDNFYQQTNTYGRNRTGLVICPTADWTTVRRAHYQAVKARAIENRYSIVRAAACGISAIIAPTGEILAEMDHYIEGPGMLVADVPVCTDSTIFSKNGFGLPLSFFALIAIYILQKKEKAVS